VIVSRLDTFTTWMDSVDDSVKELERDTMSSQEYKDTIDKFQVRRPSHVLNSLFSTVKTAVFKGVLFVSIIKLCC